MGLEGWPHPALAPPEGGFVQLLVEQNPPVSGATMRSLSRTRFVETSLSDTASKIMPPDVTVLGTFRLPPFVATMTTVWSEGMVLPTHVSFLDQLTVLPDFQIAA